MGRLGPFNENTIIIGDCFETMREIPKESVDLILTDPAYESLRRWEGIGTTARMGLGKKGSNADDPSKFFPTISNDDLPDLVQEFDRILKPSRHIYIMCDFETLKILYSVAIGEGVFAPVGYHWLAPCKPLIWDKMAMGTGYTYRQQYEFILMLWKGPKKRQLNDLSIPDILRFKRVAGKDKLIPTQKPIELFELLISQSTQEGESVFDPFYGAGTTMVAADRLKRLWFGCDIQQKCWELAWHRIEMDRAARQLELL